MLHMQIMSYCPSSPNQYYHLRTCANGLFHTYYICHLKCHNQKKTYPFVRKNFKLENLNQMTFQVPILDESKELAFPFALLLQCSKHFLLS